jgi:hypothetical protein
MRVTQHLLIGLIPVAVDAGTGHAAFSMTQKVNAGAAASRGFSSAWRGE